MRFNKRVSELQTKKCDHVISLSHFLKNLEACGVCDENKKTTTRAKVSTILQNGTEWNGMPDSVKYLFYGMAQNKPKQLPTLELLLWIGCRCIPSKYSAIIADVLTIIATFTDYLELKHV